MRLSHLLNTPAGGLLAFLASAFACLALSLALAGSFMVMIGVTRPDAPMALTCAFFAAMLLIVSAHFLRQEGRSLAALGLAASRSRLSELGLGLFVGAVLFLGVAWAQSWWVGAHWEFRGRPGVSAAIVGFFLMIGMVMTEELLFRGIALRKLRVLCGDRWAILISALLFGAYHLIGSGDWGIGLVFRFLMSTLGGLLFGWAMVRSEGLALPIGLHLGGNWVQSSLAGFGPGGNHVDPGQTYALWRIPLEHAQFQALTAPDLLPRLPYLIALLMSVWFVWRITSRQRGYTR